MTGAYLSDSFSELTFAAFFGVISPNIRIRSVRMPVASPTLRLPKRLIASVVDSEEADRFTTLFPIRMQDSIFSWASSTLSTVAARLFPASESVRIRTRFTVVRAVSAEEKKPDSRIRISNRTI